MPGAAALARRWLARVRETPRLREAALVVALCVASFEFARRVHPHYPIQRWLFWVYAKFWLLSLGWALACLASGRLAIGKLVPRIPVREAFLLSFAAGVYIFFLGMFVFGLLGLYGPALAVLWPTVLLAAGIVPLARRMRRIFGLAGYATRLSIPRPRPLALIIAAYGTVCVAFIYFSILSPDNTAYDSAWYHLALAEHYAAQGKVAGFPEGWAHGAYPQLSSLLYAWAFLIPGFGLFDRVMLCAHLEFTLFVATLAAIPIIVRRIVPRARAGLSWAAFFLFPGVFLYDSNLSTAADHIAAFWAIPLFLALIRAWRALEPRYCVLLALMFSGAVLTKYQSVALIFPCAIAMALRAGWFAVRALRRRLPASQRILWLRAVLAAGLGLLAFTAPHWLKNLIWYRDPLYPTLHPLFPGRPWHEDAVVVFETIWVPQMWKPRGTTYQKIIETLEALYKFSFEPHDWAEMHGAVPVFGSLFTLSLFAIPFLRGTRRLWGLFLSANLAVFVWYWTSHQDRYLQVQLPWMVAVVAATISLVWRAGLAARIALSALVLLQVIWGGDVPFIPSRAMTSIEMSSRLLGMGYRRQYKERFLVFHDFSQSGRELPKNAKVLIHEEHVHLGIGKPSVQDTPGFQFLLNYGRLESPSALYQALAEIGVTHLLWTTGSSRGWDTLAADLRFFEFATRHTTDLGLFGAHSRATMPGHAPKGPFNNRVLYLGCGSTFRSGQYELSDLHVHEYSTDSSVAKPNSVYPPPRREVTGDQVNALAAESGFVAVEPSCPIQVWKDRSLFRIEARRGQRELWIRLSGR